MNWPVRLICNHLFLWVCVALLPSLGMAKDKVALVIGNAQYARAGVLDNPGNDADDMTAALRELGFDVFGGQDMSQAVMLSQIAAFEDEVSDSKVALFFYAGHAFQVGGKNYLLPVDVVPTSAQAVLDASIPLDLALAAMEKAPGLRLVFLDSCRDNPLGIDALTQEDGLARVGSAANYMITYATQPGAKAFDGEGRNGTFTAALLNHIHTPGQTLAELMIAVRKDVIAATGGQQIPWESSSLTRQFQFDPRPATVSEETMLYQLAARAQNTELMSLYLNRYPRGSHVAEVTAFLTSNEDIMLPGRSIPEEANLNDDGEALWQLAKQSRLRPVAESYLALYPDGPHVIEARRMVATLPGQNPVGPADICRELATHPRDAHGQYAGASMSDLQRNVVAALSACQSAVDSYPNQPQFRALLARATFAAGRLPDAIALYKKAADEGDLRAMVSLGVLQETQQTENTDPGDAIALYQKAANGGSIDGTTNLAVALYQGRLVQQNVPLALSLFAQASEAGSAEATFNLGQLALEVDGFDADVALDYFLKAAALGEFRGYRFAALLLDKDTGHGTDPARAAALLLRGVAEDRGEIYARFTEGSDTWSHATIAEIQRILSDAGYDVGEIDGILGPKLIAALASWRNGGFDPDRLPET